MAVSLYPRPPSATPPPLRRRKSKTVLLAGLSNLFSYDELEKIIRNEEMIRNFLDTIGDQV